MKIYTSYFANMSKLSKEGVMPICIARYAPRWYSGPQYLDVAPTGYMLSAACNHEEYLKKYDDILKRLVPADVVRSIERISQGRDVALCCYEKPGDFCHRHLLADWLTKNGYEVKEWESKEEKAKAQQLSLFD